MRFLTLASDYDGTLAHNGIASEDALEGLRQLRKSGRRSILVTGRLLEDLRTVFGELELFDAVVVENGAVLYDPATREKKALAPAPDPAFVAALRAKNVSPLDVGDVIVSTWHPHEETVVQTIRELGLDLAVIFNKGAVMILPAGVNKATGLAAQLSALGLSLHNVAGIGDAENDLAFLAACEASAATANALDSVKSACDLVTSSDHGAGVAEFIERIIGDELSGVPSIDRRHAIDLGSTAEGERVSVPARCKGVLLAGTSGGGKTTFVSGFVERLSAQGYQFCIVDPEGDYASLTGAIAVGDAQSPPNLDTLAGVISAGQNPVVSLLAVQQDDRPAFAHRLMARIAELRAASGRPHWVVLDEAHHLFPEQSEALPAVDVTPSTFFVTTRPELVLAGALVDVEIVVAVGDDPSTTIEAARKILGASGPGAVVALDHAHTGTAVVWKRSEPERLLVISTTPGKSELRRHVRKYAEGELAPEKSFYFTGPEGRQNLRAQNLMTFAALSDGVDDETWHYHLGRHDYSNWMQVSIGDDELAEAVRKTEDDSSLSPRESRDAIIAAVRQRYTSPG
jgi:hydroxymethylpyrimidine pyrophosphatase-like HAD family hydrolase